MRVLAANVVFLILAGCVMGGPGPSPPTGQDFSENFDALEQMPQGWSIRGGTWLLADDANAPSAPHVVAGQPGSTEAVFLADGKGTYNTVNISATVLPEGAGRFGILIHAIGHETYHRLEFAGTAGAATMRIVEVFEGKEKVLAEANPKGPISRTRISLSFDSTNLYAWGGGEGLSAVAPRLTVGSVGLWVGEGKTAFDNVFVDRTTA